MSNNLNQQNHDDTSNTSTNADPSNTNNSNSSKIKIKGADGQIHEYDSDDILVKRLPVENTDFEIVGNNELGWILTLGKFKLTEPLRSEKDVIDYLNEKPWKVQLALTYAVVKAIQQENIDNLYPTLKTSDLRNQNQ